MKKGFTLVELLIVIAIVAVLATAVTLVLNPAELLKQARDSNRIGDVESIHSAIGLYLSSVSSTTWPGTAASTTCTSAGSAPYPFGGSCPIASSNRAVDGTGWVPVRFSDIPGGTPLAILPLDPINNTTYFYAFRSSSTGIYELNAKLESAKYATAGSADNKMANSSDGGNNDSWYEVGTSLSL